MTPYADLSTLYYIIGENHLKFKIIFILFNVVVLFSLLMITFMPVLMLGPEYGASFFASIWYVVALFIVVIAAVDAYFISNWKIFRFLEEEKWDDLIVFLEKRIKDGRIPGKFVIRIMVNAYLSRSNLEGIERLAALIKEKRPALYRKLLLIFTIPVLLKGEPGLIEESIAPYVFDKKVNDRIWLKYLLSFSFLLQRKKKEGAEILSSLCREKISPVLLMLVLYSFSPFAADDDERMCIDEKKNFLKNKYSNESMGLQVEKERSNVIVAVLSGVVNEALDWLYDRTTKIEIEE